MNLIFFILKKEGGKDGNIGHFEKLFAATEQGFVERNLHISCCCSILGTQKHILLLNYGILEVTGKACNEGELGVFSRQKVFHIKMFIKNHIPRSGQGSGRDRHVLHSEAFIGRVYPAVKEECCPYIFSNLKSCSVWEKWHLLRR